MLTSLYLTTHYGPNGLDYWRSSICNIRRLGLSDCCQQSCLWRPFKNRPGTLFWGPRFTIWIPYSFYSSVSTCDSDFSTPDSGFTGFRKGNGMPTPRKSDHLSGQNKGHNPDGSYISESLNGHPPNSPSWLDDSFDAVTTTRGVDVKEAPKIKNDEQVKVRLFTGFWSTTLGLLGQCFDLNPSLVVAY